MTRGEVQEVGRRQTEVGDVDALGAHALGEGRGELHARSPHVAGHQDLGGAGEAGEGAPDGPAHVGVELVGHRATDVVGLEDLVHPAHGTNHRGRHGAPRRPVHPDGPACRQVSVDHPAPLAHDGHDGDEVEGGVRHHVHAQATGPVRDRGQDDAEGGQPGQLDPLAVGQAEEEPVEDHGQDDADARAPPAARSGVNRRTRP